MKISVLETGGKVYSLMKIERIKNTKKNIYTGIISRSITIILPFFVRTVLIRKIGVEYIGLNSLFTSILQVLNLADLGFDQAVVFCMYKPIAEDDTKTISALMNYFRMAYRIIGSTIFVCGMMIMPFIPKLIKGDIPSNINVYVLFFIYLSNTSLSYFMFAYKQALPSAMQRMDIINNVQTISTMFTNIFQLIILNVYPNYYVFILVIPLSTVFYNIMISLYVDRRFPEYKAKGKISNQMRAKIRKQLSGLLIGKICAVSRNSFDSIFISLFLGLTVTAMYSNYYLIMSSITAMALVITNAIVSGIGNSIVIEPLKKNYADFKTLDYIYMWVAGWAAITMFCLYKPFMILWVGEKYTFPVGVSLLFSLYFYVQKMGDIRGVYADAAGLWWENRYRSIFEAVINVILNYILVQVAGIYGIIVATLISLFFIGWNLSARVLYKYYFSEYRLSEYYRYHLKYFIATFFAGAITAFLCFVIEIQGVCGFVFQAGVCCLLPNIIYYMLYFKSKTFQEAKAWVMPKLTRKGI